MKRFVMIAAILILLFVFCSGCYGSKQLWNDTPENAGLVAMMALKAKNFEIFKTYLTDSQKSNFTEADFTKLSNIVTGSAGTDTYNLLTFDNGEMLILNTVKDVKDGNYKIQQIKRVPDDLKPLFNK